MRAQEREPVEQGVQSWVRVNRTPTDGRGKCQFPRAEFASTEQLPDALDGHPANIWIAWVAVKKVVPRNAAVRLNQLPTTVPEARPAGPTPAAVGDHLSTDFRVRDLAPRGRSAGARGGLRRP